MNANKSHSKCPDDLIREHLAKYTDEEDGAFMIGAIVNAFRDGYERGCVDSENEFAGKMKWHDYPKEKPPRTGVQYLVQFKPPRVAPRFDVDTWFGDCWFCVSNIIRWAEIQEPK